MRPRFALGVALFGVLFVALALYSSLASKTAVEGSPVPHYPLLRYSQECHVARGTAGRGFAARSVAENTSGLGLSVDLVATWSRAGGPPAEIRRHVRLVPGEKRTVEFFKPATAADVAAAWGRCEITVGFAQSLLPGMSDTDGELTT